MAPTRTTRPKPSANPYGTRTAPNSATVNQNGAPPTTQRKRCGSGADLLDFVVPDDVGLNAATQDQMNAAFSLFDRKKRAAGHAYLNATPSPNIHSAPQASKSAYDAENRNLKVQLEAMATEMRKFKAEKEALEAHIKWLNVNRDVKEKKEEALYAKVQAKEQAHQELQAELDDVQIGLKDAQIALEKARGDAVQGIHKMKKSHVDIVEWFKKEAEKWKGRAEDEHEKRMSLRRQTQ